MKLNKLNKLNKKKIEEHRTHLGGILETQVIVCGEIENQYKKLGRRRAKQKNLDKVELKIVERIKELDCYMFELETEEKVIRKVLGG